MSRTQQFYIDGWLTEMATLNNAHRTRREVSSSNKAERWRKDYWLATIRQGGNAKSAVSAWGVFKPDNTGINILAAMLCLMRTDSLSRCRAQVSKTVNSTMLNKSSWCLTSVAKQSSMYKKRSPNTRLTEGPALSGSVTSAHLTHCIHIPGRRFLGDPLLSFPWFYQSYIFHYISSAKLFVA